jgi:predicted transcriptional regulator
VNKVSTSVYLDPDLIQWLKDEAARRRCSMAQVIRTAIVEMMTRSQKVSDQ